MELMLLAVVLVLIGVVVFLCLRFEKERQLFAEERQDLYNRILAAGNPIEYGILKGDTNKPTVKNPFLEYRRRQKTALEELQNKE